MTAVGVGTEYEIMNSLEGGELCETLKTRLVASYHRRLELAAGWLVPKRPVLNVKYWYGRVDSPHRVYLGRSFCCLQAFRKEKSGSVIRVFYAKQEALRGFLLFCTKQIQSIVNFAFS